MSHLIQITLSPAEALQMAKCMPAHSHFFVRGATPLYTSENTYLPLAGNVAVTRKAMIEYLTDIQETADSGVGDNIRIKVSAAKHYFFV